MSRNEIDRLRRRVNDLERRIDQLEVLLEQRADHSEAIGDDAATADLDISTSVKTKLIDAGLNTVGEIRQKTPRDLMRISGFGRASLREICVAAQIPYKT